MNKYKFRNPRRAMPGQKLPDVGTKSAERNEFRLQREREFAGSVRFFLSDTPNETSGLVGIHLDQTADTASAFGLSLDVAETPVAELYATDAALSLVTALPTTFTLGGLTLTGGATVDALTVTGATSVAGVNSSGTAALTNVTVSGTSNLTGLLAAVDIAYSGTLSNTSGGLRLNTASVTPGLNADYTLLAAEYKCGIIILNTGAWLAGHNVIVPLVTSSVWCFVNTTAFAATVKASSGTGIVVAAARSALLRHDGTNMRRVSADIDYTT